MKRKTITTICLGLIFLLSGCNNPAPSEKSPVVSIESPSPSILSPSPTSELTPSPTPSPSSSPLPSPSPSPEFIVAEYEGLSFTYNPKNIVEIDTSFLLTFESQVAAMWIYMTDDIDSDIWPQIQHNSYLDQYDSLENQQHGTDTIAGCTAIIDSFVGVIGEIHFMASLITFYDDSRCYTFSFSGRVLSENVSEYLSEFEAIVKSVKFLDV